MKTEYDMIRSDLEKNPGRSAWSRGVTVYALELLEELEENLDSTGDAFPCNVKLLEKALLNGADDWSQYSWGGCSLIYNGDIAARLCTPSELKRTRNGEKDPNPREQWLDTQARALYQACNRITRTASRLHVFDD